MGENGKILVLNISDPSNPINYPSLNGGNPANKLVNHDNKLYIAGGDAGLIV